MTTELLGGLIDRPETAFRTSPTSRKTISVGEAPRGYLLLTPDLDVAYPAGVQDYAQMSWSEAGDLLTILVLLVIPGGAAFAAVYLMARSTARGIAGGLLLALIAGLIPLFLAYAFSIGILGSALGVSAGAFAYGRGLTWQHRTWLGVAMVIVIAEPVVALNAWQVRSEETYSRCAADEAVSAIELSRREGRGYPPDMIEVAAADGHYGDTPCYVSKGVNWLYRTTNPGDYAIGYAGYTLGYWVDWRVTRRVCLYSSASRIWSCGFETWGPFRPGETD